MDQQERTPKRQGIDPRCTKKPNDPVSIGSASEAGFKVVFFFLIGQTLYWRKINRYYL